MAYEDVSWKLGGACANDFQLLQYMMESKNDIFNERDLFPDGKMYCRMHCTIREQCHTYAMQNPDLYGVWGGYSHLDRNKLRRQMDKQLAKLQARWKALSPDAELPNVS